MKFCKKLVAIVLAGVLALTMLTACGNAQAEIDLSRSGEILVPINQRRTMFNRSTLTLSEEASLQLANYAKAAAAYNADNAAYSKAAINAAIQSAETEIRKLKIDGQPVCIRYHYTFYGSSSANEVREALGRNAGWFVQEKETDCNYVAIASYGSGKESATVVMTLYVKK